MMVMLVLRMTANLTPDVLIPRETVMIGTHVQLMIVIDIWDAPMYHMSVNGKMLAIP
jgi:hypothetical protein